MINLDRLEESIHEQLKEPGFHEVRMTSEELLLFVKVIRAAQFLAERHVLPDLNTKALNAALKPFTGSKRIEVSDD